MKKYIVPFFLLLLFVLSCPQPDNNSGGGGGGWDPRLLLDVNLALSTQRFLKGEAISDNRSLKLYGAKNEWVSFQINLRSGNRVIIEDIQMNSNPNFKSAFYNAHQVYIDYGSKQNKSFVAGWYPDALIPVRNPATGADIKGARFDGLPYFLGEDRTQTFFVDIKIPPTASAGDYRLTYRIKTNKGTVENLTVDLTVWNFSIPDTSSLPIIFGDPVRFIKEFYDKKGDSYYSGLSPDSWAKISNNCNNILLENRLNPEITVYDFYMSVDYATGNLNRQPVHTEILQNFIDTYKPTTMEVPIGRTNSLKKVVFNDFNYNYHTYNKNDFTPEAQERLKTYMKSWDSFLSTINNHNTTFYLYLCDEPDGSKKSYDYARDLGKLIKGLGLSNIKVLVTEQMTPDTGDPNDNLYGAVDIWTPSFYSNDLALANQRRAFGEKVYTYTAMDHKDVPNWLIDFPLTHYKLPVWLIYNTGCADGMLYWALTKWAMIPSLDPWTDMRTWSHVSTGEYLYGDGSLFYPGKDVGLPDSIVPSMRLKSFRDAMEEYEYFKKAESLNLGNEVKNKIGSVASDWKVFIDDPSAVENVRIEIGNMISQAAAAQSP